MYLKRWQWLVNDAVALRVVGASRSIGLEVAASSWQHSGGSVQSSYRNMYPRGHIFNAVTFSKRGHCVLILGGGAMTNLF